MSTGNDGLVEAMASKLYAVMPGAPLVPYDGERGVLLWGEVQENEHWLFCKTVARLIVEHSGRVYVECD
jgi:hypothetical protein